MPRNFRLFSITRHTTTINLVDSTLNITRIQEGLRHMDRSTTITNRDAFNVELESTVIGQSLSSTTSPGNEGHAPTPLVPPSPIPSTVHHEHNIDSISEMPFNLSGTGTQGFRPQAVEMDASVHGTATTSHFDIDERESNCVAASSPIKKNKFKSVCKKVKHWIKGAL